MRPEHEIAAAMSFHVRRHLELSADDALEAAILRADAAIRRLETTRRLVGRAGRGDRRERIH